MNYRCETDPARIKDYVQNAAVVAFDFETSPLIQYREDSRASLDAHRACIVGVSLSVAEGSAIYVPLEHLEGGNADPGAVYPMLEEMVWTNPGVVKVAHNLAFESMFLYAQGIVVQPPCYDTIAAAQLTLKEPFTFRSLSDCGLKRLVPELLGDELPTFEDVTAGRYFDELPSHDPETVRYACADSDYALRLYHLFNRWFMAQLPKHRWIVEDIESPTAVYCGLMKYNGLETYRSGGDIHAATTSVIFGIPYEQAVDKNAPDYKERRTIAKNVNFGVFYGLFAKGLQRTLKFKAGLDKSLDDCQEIISNLKAGYPNLTRWQAKARDAGVKRQYTQTFLGRRRYLPGIRSQDWGRRSFAERCALNTPIQGTAADILKLSLGRLITGLPDRPWLRPLLQIHDELVFELPEERLTEAVAFIQECMDAKPFPELDVPLVAEASWGYDFGHMNEME